MVSKRGKIAASRKLSTSSSAELLAELESAFLDDSLSDDAGVMGTEPLLDLEDEAEFFDY